MGADEGALRPFRGTGDYYGFFEVYLSLLAEPSSFVRTRGFTLIAAQARWDTEGKTAANKEALLTLLD